MPFIYHFPENEGPVISESWISPIISVAGILSEEILWKLRCRGYLYADIQMAGDCVLILTAGAGGHFYAVRLTTGEVLCDINNGGTKQFVLDVDRVYLLSRKGGSRALAVSTKDWKPLWEESLQHTVSTSSRFAVRDGVLYAVTFRYKNRLPAEAYLETLPLR